MLVLISYYCLSLCVDIQRLLTKSQTSCPIPPTDPIPTIIEMESGLQIGQQVGSENDVEIQHGSAAAATATAAKPPIGAGVTTAIGSYHPQQQHFWDFD